MEERICVTTVVCLVVSQLQDEQNAPKQVVRTLALKAFLNHMSF